MSQLDALLRLDKLWKMRLGRTYLWAFDGGALANEPAYWLNIKITTHDEYSGVEAC